MTTFKTLLVLGATLFVLITVIHAAAINTNEEEEDPDKLWTTKEGRFFRSLKKEEQYALMAMSIANYNVTSGSEDSSLFPWSPLSKPGPEDIPRTLYAKMMNGEVPKNFMIKFNIWLRLKYRLTNRSFDKFATTVNDDRLCRDEEGEDCIHIDDAGSQCCPFG